MTSTQGASPGTGVTRHDAGVAARAADEVHRQLLRLSQEVGRPERDLVVLAEGNTSALLDDGTFLVKASGARLGAIEAGDFVRLRLDPLLDAVLDDRSCDVRALFEAAAVEASTVARPSIETFVHVVSLGLGGGRYAVHTHPTPVVALLCASAAEEIVTAGPLFPDEVVVCGATPLYLDYFEPGLELGRALAARVKRHVAAHGRPPQTIYLGNHGLLTVGASADEALAVTEMAVKAARVRAGALVAGAIRPLPPRSAAELMDRADERERRERLWEPADHGDAVRTGTA